MDEQTATAMAMATATGTTAAEQDFEIRNYMTRPGLVIPEVDADAQSLRYMLFSAWEQDPRNPLYLHVARYISRLHQRAAQQEQQLAAAAAEVQRRSGGGAQPITLQPTTIQATNVTPIAAGSTNVIAPETKKRKLEDDTTSAAMTSSVGVAWDAPAAVIVSDLSFSLPARRKLSLELVKDCGIRVTNAQGEVECRMAFADIDQIIATPTPEKAQPTRNFTVVPKTNTPPMPRDEGASTAMQAIVFSIPENATQKTTRVYHPGIPSSAPMQSLSVVEFVKESFKITGKMKVVEPDAAEFVSGIVQAHRKDEKAWHAKAWRGNKEGFLYFLGPGILFGFKKPILYFPLHSIHSIYYSSVLGRTFNLTIVVSSSDADATATDEHEFAMLDQADYAGVDDYVKRHKLHDASLAGARRAQRTEITKPNAGAANGDASTGAAGDKDVAPARASKQTNEGHLAAAAAEWRAQEAKRRARDGHNGFDDELDDENDANGQMQQPEENDELTDAQRAERDLQDEEDENEEDYDPGSDGESEGEGESSEEEEAHDAGAEEQYDDDDNDDEDEEDGGAVDEDVM